MRRDSHSVLIAQFELAFSFLRFGLGSGFKRHAREMETLIDWDEGGTGLSTRPMEGQAPGAHLSEEVIPAADVTGLHGSLVRACAKGVYEGRHRRDSSKH